MKNLVLEHFWLVIDKRLKSWGSGKFQTTKNLGSNKSKISQQNFFFWLNKNQKICFHWFELKLLVL